MVNQSNSQNSFENKSKKNIKKYRKDALEIVDIEDELKKDPKYKTELCSSFNQTQFCSYGNKCRFAHGKSELFNKNISHPRYRKSSCLSFMNQGHCPYGQRCHFKHWDLNKLQDINRSYFTFLVKIYYLLDKKIKIPRLASFVNIVNDNLKNNNILNYFSKFSRQRLICSSSIFINNNSKNFINENLKISAHNLYNN